MSIETSDIDGDDDISDQDESLDSIFSDSASAGSSGTIKVVDDDEWIDGDGGVTTTDTDQAQDEEITGSVTLSWSSSDGSQTQEISDHDFSLEYDDS